LVLAIAVPEEIVQSHAKVVADGKKKLINTVYEQVPVLRSLIQLMNAIVVCQTNMVQR
jgi:hypothetical protein